MLSRFFARTLRLGSFRKSQSGPASFHAATRPSRPFSWLRALGLQPSPRANSFFRRPSGEPLENRSLLATISWDGGGGDFNWNTAGNWSTDVLPGGGDDVKINATGNVTIAVTSDVAIRSLQTTDAVTVVGVAFSLSADSQIDAQFTNAGGIVSLINVTLTGTGQFINASGGTLSTIYTPYRPGDSVLNIGVSNNGDWEVQGFVYLNGALTTGASSAIRILEGDAFSIGDARLIVADGFTNHGLIELSAVGSGAYAYYASVLTVSQGTLVNAPEGIVRSLQATGSGPGGGGRRLEATLDNQGLLDVTQYGLDWRNDSGQSANSGTIQVGSRVGLGLGQVGTDPRFTNTGTIEVSADGYFGVEGGTFDDSQGSLVDPGYLGLRYTTATLDAQATAGNLTTWVSTVTLLGDLTPLTTSLTNTTVNGAGWLVNPVGGTLTTIDGAYYNGDSVLNIGVSNNGDWEVQGFVYLNGALTTGASSAIRILEGDAFSIGDARLIVADGFTNHGLIELSAVGSGAYAYYASVLTVSQGTLVNAPEGIVRSLQATGSGPGGGGRRLEATLDNQGLLDVTQYGLDWRNDSGQSTNSGTIQVGSRVGLGLGQVGTDPRFTNTGTIEVSADGYFGVSSGAVMHNSGTWLMNGGLTLDSVTLTLQTDITAGQVATYLNGTTVNGPGMFVNPAGATLYVNTNPWLLRETRLNALLNNGMMVVAGDLFIEGAGITNSTTATIDIQSDGIIGSSGADCPILTNAGLIVKSAGNGTTHMHMQLYNSGTVRIDSGTLNVDCGYVQVVGDSGGGGTGAISGNFTGEVSIANPGELDLEPSPTPPPPVTNYTQTVTGSVNEQIGGLTPGTEYGQIIVDGDVSLAGSLHLQLINDFRPHLGDQFTIIDNRGGNPIGGQFSGLPEGTTLFGGTYGFTISYIGGTGGIGNDVVLTTTVVNQPPVAVNDSYSLAEDGTLIIASLGLLTNDSDADGDMLAAALVTGPAHGVLTFHTDGSFTYLPTSNYYGADSFTYRASDGNVDSNLATVDITVTPVNDTPVAVNDSYSSVAEDGILTVAAILGVLANDTDVEGDVLSAAVVNKPLYGALALNSDGSFTYTPGAGCGATSDSFSYTISDGHGETATSTVSITIAQYSGVSVDGTGTVLRFGGGAGPDVVSIHAGNLRVNGIDYSLAGISEVRIWGRGGNDPINLAGLAIKTFIDGGDGIDVLDGGGADDVIFGGAGNDTISGGTGNDFLFGGTGIDVISGNAGNDILVSGDIDCLLGLAALREISQAWVNSRGAEDAMGDDILDETVVDTDVDTLTGGTGADLFIISGNDNITDFTKPKKNKDGDIVITVV
jgi:VCBS repeat-containing protein